MHPTVLRVVILDDGTGGSVTPPAATTRDYIVFSLPFPVYVSETATRQHVIYSSYVNEAPS